uniref:Uncharacterized protein n=1 Tax=Caenorhabditis japonica TaxID=281687 RepID=A0A8R1HQL5_CAEJA
MMHQEEKKPEPFLSIQPPCHMDPVEEVVSMLRPEKFEPASPSTTGTMSPSAPFRAVRYEKPKCAVCLEDGDGLHFGAEACRACTAFFRRSVALNKKYECRAGGNCQVASNIRCMCRACRFTKCRNVGMNPECVQNRRDTTGAREMTETKPFTLTNCSPPPPPTLSSSSSSAPSSIHAPVPVHQNNRTSLLDFSLFKSESTSSFSPFSLPASLPGLIITPSLDTMPLLERMRMNYEKMENARTVIHRRDGESIFQQKVPRSLNFREATEVTSKEVALVADWVEWCFDDFSVLPTDQKTILFQNFFVYFSMLEKSFMTMKSGKDNVMIMASKDYIDYDNLEPFFRECGSDPACPPDELAKCFSLIKPSFELQRRSLINLMKIENLDQYEFFAICVMLFWDYGLEGQSDDCNEVGRKVKHQAAREMAFYLRHVKKHEEPLYRLANMVAILPSLQRAVRRFQEDIQMAHIFNIYALPADFFNIVNGRFS